MKTRFLIIATLLFVFSGVLWIVGIAEATKVKDAIWEFQNSATTIPGSSGGGFPSYDGVWVFFESGTLTFATGILLLIWRKRKLNKIF